MKEEQRKVLILYTGGTIGMRSKPGGGGLAPESMEDLQKNIPQIEGLPYDIEWQECKYEGKFIDSSFAGPKMWNVLGEKIMKNYDKCDGMVVVFGTDTMGPSATALSYHLEGLKKPVIFTGSMKPAVDEDSDGPKNMVDAIRLAGESGRSIPSIEGVSICFFGKLTNPADTFKISAQALDAMGLFKDKNPLATINDDEIIVGNIQEKNNLQSEARYLPKTDKRVAELNVGFRKMFRDEESLVVRAEGVDGILLYNLQEDTMYPEKLQAFYDGIEKQYSNKVIFFMGDNLPNKRWVKLKCSTNNHEHINAVLKAEYILQRTSNLEEIKKLAESNLRGESEGPIVNETEILKWMEANREVQGAKDRR
ncbi:MAG: asparaginase [Candidatus Magasanikbacteria bacterium]